MSLEKNKSVGLVRISSVSQSEKYGGTGIEFQSKKLQEYSNLMDLELVETIVDIASGGLAERDGITHLKEMIEEGKVDKVLIWNTSRCFRSMIHFAKFYEYMNENDVELISVGEGIRSGSKEGAMIFGIMISISSYEKSIIAERCLSGKIVKLKAGKRAFGGRLPFGYKKEGKDIVLDEVDGQAVKFIYKTMNRFNNKPYSKTKKTQKMLSLLKKNGYNYKGKDFQYYHLKSILGNEFYIGELNYGSNAVNHLHPTIISKRLFNTTMKGLA